MQIFSLIWGLFALIGFFIGLIPCLGSLNWLNIPFAAVGLIISIVAYTSDSENKSPAAIAIAFNSIAIAFGIIRLIIGFGIF